MAVLTIVTCTPLNCRVLSWTTAGWLMVQLTLAMALTTFLTTWFHRRGLRHVWLIVGRGGVGGQCLAGCRRTDNFTPKEHVALILACWGRVPLRADPARLPN